MSVSDCVTDRLFCRLPPENTRQKTHSRTDVRSFAGGNPLQPPPFRRATPLRCVQTSTSAEDTRHSLRSCLVSSASVAVCTQLHYVALLHSKRCLSVTASQTGFFVGYRRRIPGRKLTRALTCARSQGETPCNPHRSAEPLRYVVCRPPLRQRTQDTHCVRVLCPLPPLRSAHNSTTWHCSTLSGVCQ